MKKQERLRRESEWVKARLRCSPENVFEQIFEVIKADIKTFGELSDNESCKIDRTRKNIYTFSHRNRLARFSMEGATFIAEPHCTDLDISDGAIRITMKWNEAKMRCDLIVDDKRISVHRISQMLLADILFPH